MPTGIKGFQYGHKINVGKPCLLETRKKIADAQRGKIISQETIEKIKKERAKQVFTEERNKKISISNSGSNHWNWQGGLTAMAMKIRMSREYKIWRIAVFKRDNYTCCECGVLGGCLNAHHIKPFSNYPKLCFVVDNGKTLCIKCHKKTSTFGWIWAQKKNKKHKT